MPGIDPDVLPAAWAEESFDAARTRAYTKPDGQLVMDNDLLSDEYFNAARPTVVERLKQG